MARLRARHLRSPSRSEDLGSPSSRLRTKRTPSVPPATRQLRDFYRRGRPPSPQRTGRYLRGAFRITDEVVSRSRLARSASARRSSGSSRTDSTLAGPEPIGGRPPRRRSVSSTSKPASASPASSSTSSSVISFPLAVLPCVLFAMVISPPGSSRRYFRRIFIAWITSAEPSSRTIVTTSSKSAFRADPKTRRAGGGPGFSICPLARFFSARR